MSTGRLDYRTLVCGLRYHVHSCWMYLSICSRSYPTGPTPFAHIMTLTQLLTKIGSCTLNTRPADEVFKTFTVHIYILCASRAFLKRWKNFFTIMVLTHLFTKRAAFTIGNDAFNIGSTIMVTTKSQGKDGRGARFPRAMVSLGTGLTPVLVT